MLLDLVFPKRCVSCKKTGSYICKKCRKDISFAEPFCPVCGKRAIDGVTHFGCKKKLGLDGVVCIWNYSGVIRKAILALKYKFTFDLASELCLLARSSIKQNFSLSFLKDKILVPIPLSSGRKKWRGFNQTEILGKTLSEHFGWRFSSNLLLRKKFVRPQTGLGKKERSKNIRGNFQVNPEYKKILRKNVQIVLFDDVWTTGATLKEACKTLKRKGFPVVWGFTLAKT